MFKKDKPSESFLTHSTPGTVILVLNTENKNDKNRKENF